MGATLSAPNTSKISESGSKYDYEYATCLTQGWKTALDNYLLISPYFDEDNSLFAIFEAEGSQFLAEYIKNNFIGCLLMTKEYHNEEYDKALLNTFETIDKFIISELGEEKLKESYLNDTIGVQGGCSALVVLITRDHIYVANAGISRCVIQFEGKHKTMSNDHYPSNDLEKQRILSAGGEVWENKINAHIPISRGLGFKNYKNNPSLEYHRQLIIGTPEIKWIEKEYCDMILIGGNGFWQNWTNGGITDVIMERVKAGKQKQKILEDVVDSCIAYKIENEYGLDNVSCILIVMNK